MSRTPPPTSLPPRLLSSAEAAAYLHISINTLRHYVAAGQIPARRVGVKLLRYDPADLDRFAKAGRP